MTPKEMASKHFDRSKMFGYKIKDVDDFFAEALKNYEEVYNNKIELEKKVDFLVEKLAEYRQQEGKLTDILLEAKKVSDNIIRKAKEKSDLLISNAENQASKIISDAQNQVKQQQLLLLSLKKETSEFKNNILAMYKSHIDKLSELPSYVVNESLNDSLNDDCNENVDISPETNTQKLKERTFSISLDKNGTPIKIDEEGINDTKNIPLHKDIKDVSHKYSYFKNNGVNNKFKEPLKFGENYNVNSKLKKNKLTS